MEEENKKLKINEIFQSLAGEGKFIGQPALFIRMSGCSLSCDFCDTAYHNKVNFELSPEELAKRIIDSGEKIIIFTGGEPTCQLEPINTTIEHVSSLLCKNSLSPIPLDFHIETNGYRVFYEHLYLFDYICVSPKNLRDAKDAYKRMKEKPWILMDIKVVTDMEKVNIDLLGLATILMPLSTGNARKDKKIKQAVWEYCSKHKIKYSARIHVDVFGLKKRGV